MARRPEELAQLSVGAVLGAAVAAYVASLIRPLFGVPSGGVGYITVHHYPKNWDTAVVALLVFGSCAGALIAAHWTPQPPPVADSRPRWLAVAIVVFALVCVIH